MTIEQMLNLSWAALNAALLACMDEAELECWLAATVASGKRTRAQRIQGRLNAVRRQKELTALPPKAATWPRRKKSEAA